MHKIIWFLSLLVIAVVMHAIQLEQETALRTLLQAKNSVNRAAQAAAQQIDPVALSSGIRRIDEAEAERVALQYLREHFHLNESLEPEEGSSFKNGISLQSFEVIQPPHVFPYTYYDPVSQTEAMLHKPGVILIIRLEYPRIFSWVDAFAWDIRSAGEIMTLSD